MSEDDSSSAMAEDTTEETAEETNGVTILYAMPRQALTTEDIREIREALNARGYSLVPSDGGDNVMIQRDEETGDSVDFSEIL
jgi:uncharacterized protein YcgL (UPF0745 family)